MEKYNFALTDQAEQDIKDIWLYIACDSVQAAENVVTGFEQAFCKLASSPYIASKREELTATPVRFWIVHNYYIIYNPDTSPLQILRIISSYQDIKTHYK
jgi:plasmid stabilization system protein ParE